MLEPIKKRTEERGGHLIWTGAMAAGGPGYPAMKHEGRTVYVRRWIWERLHGTIPSGMTVRACCGERRCVHPDHLCLMPNGRRPGAPRNPKGRYVPVTQG